MRGGSSGMCPCERATGEGCPSGSIETAAGRVPCVAARGTWHATLGAAAVRWGIGRRRYTVPPGLVAVGTPTPDSPLVVTANYQLSLDHVRWALEGMDGWVLVLDTKGINVWCAAGKGTFGTDELVARLESSGVAKVVGHKTLILPQLGAPGVAAHEVSRRTGFKVVYGPVYAKDLPAFLHAGMKATPEMRRVGFTLRERLAVVPVVKNGVGCAGGILNAKLGRTSSCCGESQGCCCSSEAAK